MGRLIFPGASEAWTVPGGAGMVRSQPGGEGLGPPILPEDRCHPHSPEMDLEHGWNYRCRVGD